MPDTELVFTLIGPGWTAKLLIEQPPPAEPKRVGFAVPAIDDDPAPLHVEAEVIFTTARNLLMESGGWRRWHVKIYRCATQGDAENLLRFLTRQTEYVQRANRALGARNPMRPPWGVVPVQIVRGDWLSQAVGGAQPTQLGEDVHAMEETAGGFPSWYAPDMLAAARTLLAVSPYVDEIEWVNRYDDDPVTEHLQRFTGLADGLDAMHRNDIAHCDIKPDNVCRVTLPGSTAYVLIDADAAIRVTPPPRYPRFTPTYSYGNLRRFAAESRQYDRKVPAGILYAQDRFGFALVLLSMLGGYYWVRSSLLHEDSGPPGRNRNADSHHLAVRELELRFPGERWDKLRTVLGEAFSQQIEDPEWSTADWVNRLVAAAGVEEDQRDEELQRYAEDVRQILRRAREHTQTGIELVEDGYEAALAQAQIVARRTAGRVMAAVGLAITGITVILACGAVVLGK
ncbi:hypothetical protein GA0074692_3851 [Micromonospora pallida]|uniref:Protein kinase domain-containing protein n=1 Tax=Micromonospora pallida TaxID=145854 RepID=A0A1C6SY81_9ACTN|nr:protein kinase family protein [Micromonospora pallida]SCL34516.1 hypothetical protein GA0074692_3851 [Micromonospora pallida]